jgi:hypothetical protein
MDNNYLFNHWKVTSIIVVFCTLYTSLSIAGANWQARKSTYFTVYYKENYTYPATQLLYNLEYYRKKLSQLIGNKAINKHTYFTLYDTGIISNGYYDPIFDRIGIFIYAPQPRFMSLVENWYRLAGIHEYTHKLHITNTSGIPASIVSSLGSLFHPNLWCPWWILEGITVYSESRISPYEGRLNNGYFSAYLKTRTEKDTFPDIHTITHAPFEYPWYEGYYLYGGEFFDYLATRYGEEKFSHLFSSIGSSLLSYFTPVLPCISIDKIMIKIYGKSTKELLQEWKLYKKESITIQKTKNERLTTNGWYVLYPILYQGKLYYFREYPIKTGAYRYFYIQEIVEKDISTGEERIIIPLTSEIHTPIRVNNNKLYYGITDIKRNYKNSAISDLGLISSIYEYELSTSKSTLLFRDELRAFLPISADQILYAQDMKDKFGSYIFIYSKKKKKKQLLFTIPYIISEMLYVCDKDKIFVVARRDWENWSIYTLDLKQPRLIPVVDTPFNEISISFAGDNLYFAANYDNINRIYAYNLKDNQLYKLTNDGYANYPVVDITTNTLYFVGLTSVGFDIFYKELNPERFILPKYKKSTMPVFHTIRLQEAGYIDNLKTLIPKIHIPFPIGIILIGSDAIGENYYIFIPFLYNSKAQKMYYLNTTQDNIEVKIVGFIISEFFKPHTFYIGFITDELISVGWKYPVYVRLTPGLSNVTISTNWNYHDKEKHNLYNILHIGFQYPRWNTEISAAIFSDLYHSTLTNQMLWLNSYIERYIFNSCITLLTGISYEKDKRAYNSFLRFAYSFPLFKIRKGLWNPNIYLEDLCCLLYYERADEEEVTSNIGIELQQEISLFMGNIKLPFCIGYKINNKTKDKTTYIRCGNNFFINNTGGKWHIFVSKFLRL